MERSFKKHKKIGVDTLGAKSGSKSQLCKRKALGVGVLKNYVGKRYHPGCNYSIASVPWPG